MDVCTNHNEPITLSPALRQGKITGAECAAVSQGDVVINGVPLPHLVLDELRELGVPLLYYTSMELNAAKVAANDGVLIEDPEGIGFFDKLTLTSDEAAEQQARHKSRRGAAYLHIGGSDDDDEPECEKASPFRTRAAAATTTYISCDNERFDKMREFANRFGGGPFASTLMSLFFVVGTFFWWKF